MKQLIRADSLIRRLNIYAASTLKDSDVGEVALDRAGLSDIWVADNVEKEGTFDPNKDKTTIIYTLKFSRKYIESYGGSLLEVSVRIVEEMITQFLSSRRQFTDTIIMECIGDGWRGAEIETKQIDVTDESDRDIINLISNYIEQAEQSFQESR